MKNLILLICLTIPSLCIAQERVKTIKGTISDDFGPLANVTISIKNTDNNTFADAGGKYSINANIGDVLVYESPGKRTFEIVVEDVSRILNLTLQQNVEELDEVIVTKKKVKTQFELLRDYDNNESLINTSFGFLDENSSGGAFFLQEDDITPGSICILDILRQVPGLTINGDCARGGSVSVRGRSSITLPKNAVFDVDGIVTEQVPLWILPSTIKRIAVFKSLASTNKYGALGSGGVIAINTKSITSTYDSESGKPIDRARLRDNIFNNDAIGASRTLNDMPTYLIALYEKKSIEESKVLFQEQIKTRGTSFFYILDCYSFFNKKWNDLVFADKIVADNYKVLDSNPVALKALAYLYQEGKRFDKANEMYKRAYTLRPKYAQSYYDLMRSYIELKDYTKAASIYSRFDYLKDQKFSSDTLTVFTTPFDREFNNFIALDGEEFLKTQKVKDVVVEEDFNGTRLVFEWNDSEAEFELQFVNPENQYFAWKHTYLDDPDRIVQEKTIGFSCEEFLVDNSLKGIWKINIKYLGNKKLTAAYLKVTIQGNYGKPNQSKEIKVFKLGLKNVNQQLFELSSGYNK